MSDADVGASASKLAYPMQQRNKFDVAFYREKVKSMKNSEIENLIKNAFVPDDVYLFPKTNGRCFRAVWLKSHSWLCYSPSLDGGFCLPCVLFGNRFPRKLSNIRKLFYEPVNYWPDAKASFTRHENKASGLHHETTAIFSVFLDKMSGRTQPIDVLIDTNLRKKISDNRKKLVPIVDTIILCGRLGLPFRGHRDDSRYHPDVGEYSEGGVGNFIELLNYRVRSGDVTLQSHLINCDKNAFYISKSTQNELIRCCAQVISEQLIAEVKKSKFYSILADEASDCSNKEQMSLVLRFVDDDFNIREEFLRFIHCKEGLSGKDLASVILKCLNEDLTLNIQDCCGQGYDGAGAVSGCINGLSTGILQVNRKAIYTHCYSHRLNLSICGSCSVQCVRNVMEQVKEISYFFNLSQSRQLILESNVSKHCPDTRKSKLKDVCRTRWVERIHGMDTFEELLFQLFSLLRI